MSKGDVLCALPDIFNRHAEFPADLIGSTIVQMGTIPEMHVDGGGLVIDYRPSGTEAMKRVIFAFDETGMWVYRE